MALLLPFTTTNYFELQSAKQTEVHASCLLPLETFGSAARIPNGVAHIKYAAARHALISQPQKPYGEPNPWVATLEDLVQQCKPAKLNGP